MPKQKPYHGFKIDNPVRNRYSSSEIDSEVDVDDVTDANFLNEEDQYDRIFFLEFLAYLRARYYLHDR